MWARSRDGRQTHLVGIGQNFAEALAESFRSGDTTRQTVSFAVSMMGIPRTGGCSCPCSCSLSCPCSVSACRHRHTRVVRQSCDGIFVNNLCVKGLRNTWSSSVRALLQQVVIASVDGAKFLEVGSIDAADICMEVAMCALHNLDHLVSTHHEVSCELRRCSAAALTQLTRLIPLTRPTQHAQHAQQHAKLGVGVPMADLIKTMGAYVCCRRLEKSAAASTSSSEGVKTWTILRKDRVYAKLIPFLPKWCHVAFVAVHDWYDHECDQGVNAMLAIKYTRHGKDTRLPVYPSSPPPLIHPPHRRRHRRRHTLCTK